MKTCSRCSTAKPLTEFGVLKRSKDGRNPACVTCMREYHKALYHDTPKRKSDIRRNNDKNRVRIQALRYDHLRRNPCLDCGESDYRVLDFDHLRDKDFNIADAVAKSFSWKRIEAEIQKCEVVCANCHRIRTWERRMIAQA